MNELIERLAEQATIRGEAYLPGDNGHPTPTEYFDKEKFAELIIRECIDRVGAQFVPVRDKYPGVLRRQDIHDFEIDSVMADADNRTQREQGIIHCGVNCTEALYELILDEDEEYDEEDEENYDK